MLSILYLNMISYNELESCIQNCNGKISHIGITHLGYPIPMVTKGNGQQKPRILLVGGVHAREYITSYLLCALLKEYNGDCVIDCVPLLNIDGVLLSRLGKQLFGRNDNLYKKLVALNKSEDFALWKGNIRGVDLNVNFNADWGSGAQNVRQAGSENYIGPYPESENETRAIIGLLYKKQYDMVIAYHSKGEEVYYGYGTDKSNKDLSEKIADFLHYDLKTSDNSAGGLKDYVIKVLHKFALTIEVGEDRFSHPYPMLELPKLIDLHKGSLELFCNIGETLCTRGLCLRQ